MYSLTTLILVAALSLLVGAAVTATLNRRLSPDSRKQRDLERTMERLSQQQKNYQHDVVEHFTDTAKLLDNLAESYRDVHNHLANGASKLTDNSSSQVLRPLPDSDISELVDKPAAKDLQQPLDYAPKTSPYETGTLNEEFGLDKTASNEDKIVDLVADIPTIEEANSRN